jgi:hypothetical protein
MKRHQVITASSLSLLVLSLALPIGALAKPKASWQNCTTKDLNTTFGASCNDQMQQDLMGQKPYTHVLICGGDTMLCCTIDNSTGQVQTCRKPAGTRVMPGMQNPAGMAGIKSRGTEGSDPADEEAPIPSDLTPEIAKVLLKEQPKK